MKYPVYAWKDVKIGFGAPKLALNDEVAKREFGYELNREGSIMQYSPADYELYKIGEYNTDNGHFDSLTLAEYLVNGRDVYGVMSK